MQPIINIKVFDIPNDQVLGDYFIDTPSGWHFHKQLDQNTVALQNEKNDLRVLVSVCRELDMKEWLHVSVSHKHRLPQWKEMVEVKTLFIGDDKTAYQVFPTRDKYVNHNTRVLHLWCCLNGPVTPDFTRGSSMI